MVQRIIKVLFLIIVTGCGPYRWTDVQNEILLPPTVEMREESGQGEVNVGILLHGTELKNEKNSLRHWHGYSWYSRKLTIERDAGGPFVYLKRTLPIDLFLYRGEKSAVGEIRYYPFDNKIENFSPGLGIGGLYDLNGKIWPNVTLYVNFPFKKANLYIAPRYFQTLVSTQLRWGEGFSDYHEEGEGKGEGWELTTGFNYNLSRHFGTQVEWTTFNIQEGVKDVRWPTGNPRPHLVNMDYVDSSISLSVYYRYR
jgi:hypothetical protein